MKIVEFTDIDIDKIIDSLESNLNKPDSSGDTQYFKSYFEFIKYFENIDIIDYHSLVISSYFTYGWMPTILKKFDTKNNMKQSIDVLNKVKKSIEIDESEYDTLVKCINNSIVGVSKMLHFINPQQYPIFDSRIKKYFKTNNLLKSIWKPTYQYNNNNILQYQLYRDICLEIIKNDRFEKVYNESVQKLGLDKELTKMRVLENMFFTFGKVNKS